MEMDIKKLTEKHEEKELFVNRINSKLIMNINKSQILDDDEWIDEVIFTAPYIEKALDKWNKQIVTEEEIIKIELIKKVSIESVKHLSKNTNFIAEFDQDTGDVVPSKILNAYKEESFITYENRFLYTLIKLIDDFIFLRTREDEQRKDTGYKGKKYQSAKYEGIAKIDRERVKLNFEYISEETEEKEKSIENEEKIKELKKRMDLIKATELFKFLDSQRIVLVKSPLKMTNVLLKNVNFQYCVKLWGYLNSHLDEQTKNKKAQKEYEEKGHVKDLIDEDFFIKYSIFDTINSQGANFKKIKKATLNDKERKELTEKLIERLITLNPDFTDYELKKLIAERYVAYRNKKDISLKPLEAVFNKKIKEYLEKIGKLRIK